jgi:valyl-tRNA synthetase
VRFSEGMLDEGAKLANKLWNAARFVLLQTDPEAEPAPLATTAEDRWILSRLAGTIDDVVGQLDAYDFAAAVKGLYGFIWNDFCDWYVEAAKARLYGEDAAARSEASATLLWVLEHTVALAHPVMPFVTEEIWSLMPGEERGLLAVADFPVADESRFDEGAERDVDRMIEAVTALRRYRDEVGARPGAAVRGHLVADGYDGLGNQMARLARFEWAEGADSDPRSPAAAGQGAGGDVIASVPIPGGAVQVLPSDAFDAGEGEARIDKKRADLGREIERAEKKLSNEQFVAKAPAAVVDEERRKLAEYREALAQLKS